MCLLTHWGRVMHICVSRLTIIGSDNDLSPDRHQAIIWTYAAISSIGPMGTNLSEFLIKIYTFSFRKMQFQMSSGKWWPFGLGLNVLIQWPSTVDMKPNPCTGKVTVQIAGNQKTLQPWIFLISIFLHQVWSLFLTYTKNLLCNKYIIRILVLPYQFWMKYVCKKQLNFLHRYMERGTYDLLDHVCLSDTIWLLFKILNF